MGTVLFPRRGLVCGLAGSMLVAGPVFGADYPERPIRYIVNAAPGGAADSTSRLLTRALAQRLGQPFIIENRPGGSGSIGLAEVARAAPDGYTIGHANLATFVVAALATQRLPYNTTSDFSLIARQFTAPNLLGVTPSLPINTVHELVAYAKANPGRIFYGSTGTGTALHVVTELFRTVAGIQIVHVPYRSAPASELDLISGQLQMLIGNLTSMVPHVIAGRIRALAITGPSRSPLLPNVPTIAEAGYPEVQMETWGGVIGPARLPEAIVSKLNSEINAILSDPEMVSQHARLGATSAPGTVQEFRDMVAADNLKWGRVIRENNIVLE